MNIIGRHGSHRRCLWEHPMQRCTMSRSIQGIGCSLALCCAAIGAGPSDGPDVAPLIVSGRAPVSPIHDVSKPKQATGLHDAPNAESQLWSSAGLFRPRPELDVQGYPINFVEVIAVPDPSAGGCFSGMVPAPDWSTPLERLVEQKRPALDYAVKEAIAGLGPQFVCRPWFSRRPSTQLSVQPLAFKLSF